MSFLWSFHRKGRPRRLRDSPQENDNDAEGAVESPEDNIQHKTFKVDSLGVIDEAHILLENLPKKKDESILQDIDCFLCVEKWIRT